MPLRRPEAPAADFTGRTSFLGDRSGFYLASPRRSRRSRVGRGPRWFRWVFSASVFFLGANGIATAATPTVAQAQVAAAATVGGIKDLLNSAITKLTNSGALLISDANGAAAGTIGQLTQILHEFNQHTVGRTATDLVSTLDVTAQRLATQAQKLVGNVDEILTRQQTCGVVNAEAIAAAFKTSVESAKSGLPFANAEGGYLTHFTFDKYPLGRNMVPEEGGRATFVGRRLWNDGLKPDVVLRSENNTPVPATLALQRGKSDDEISVYFDPAIVAAQRGSCLRLAVTPKEKKTILWFIPNGTRDLPQAVMPLCIPQSYGMTVALDGEVHFKVPATETKPLLGKSQNFRNEDRDHWQNIDYTFNFEKEIADLGPGWAILDQTWSKGNEHLATRITSVTHTDFTIRVIGSQEDARDFQPPCVWPLPCPPRVTLENASVDIGVAPIVSRKFDTTVTVAVPQVTQPLAKGQAKLCRRYPVPTNATDISTYEFTVRGRFSEKGGFEPLYETNRVQATSNGGKFGPVTRGGLVIEGTYNPTPVNNEGEVCVTVTAAPGCGTFQLAAAAYAPLPLEDRRPSVAFLQAARGN